MILQRAKEKNLQETYVQQVKEMMKNIYQQCKVMTRKLAKWVEEMNIVITNSNKNVLESIPVVNRITEYFGRI